MTGPALSAYRTRDVARLLDLSERQVRAYVKLGFIRPERALRGAFRFSFQDLILLRAAKGLSQARISERRIRRALAELRSKLPGDRHLASVTISARRNAIVVRDGSELWSAESGQALLDFSVAELAASVALLDRRAGAPLPASEASADEWYELACEQESSNLDAARDAYLRAIGLDPRHAPAQLNLGRILHSKGAFVDAERHYRAALSANPRHATAAFNLGVVLEDLKRPLEALKAYQKAIALDERHADAHYNLAMLYERLDRRMAALRHLRIYKRLVGG